MDGGYDSGYKACTCFWGREPGSLVKLLVTHLKSVKGLNILDAGCGEGKNSIYLALKGAIVDAFDVSDYAIHNARLNWPSANGVNWKVTNVKDCDLPRGYYDVAIAYGLLHCLATDKEISFVINKLMGSTKPGGYNLICAFNSRCQDLSAHPDFSPCLVSHEFFSGFYKDWELIECSDSDLTESHPHNLIPHTHSMTRILARKPL